MSDIITRLRFYRPAYGWPEEYAITPTKSLGDEAADEIERLRAALEAIREKRYEGRDGGTFTPETAWDAAQKLNKAICEIFEIAKTAIEQK